MKSTTRTSLLLATVIALAKTAAAAPVDDGFANNHRHQGLGRVAEPLTVYPYGTAGILPTAPLVPTGAVPTGVSPTGGLTTGLPLPSTVPYPTLNFTGPTATVPGSSGPTDTGTSSSSACINVTDGTLVCNGEDFFGLCNFGSVIWQAVANGTACVDGEITWASWYPGNPANQVTALPTA